MKQFFKNFVLIVPFLSFGQMEEDFSDGNFSSNPAWTGSTADFIVNSAFQLQSQLSIAATSYLSTPHGLSDLDNREWHLYVKQNFAGSASNFSRIYLTSTDPNLTTNPDGYYLQLGESLAQDAIRLMKCEAGVTSEICAGTPAAISSGVHAGIRVRRDDNGNWTLSVDYAGEQNYVLEATAQDNSVITGSHAGFLCTYTASNATKFHFDDIYVGSVLLDLQAPTFLSGAIRNATEILISCSEPITPSSAGNIANYAFDPPVTISQAVPDSVDAAVIHLLLATPLTNGTQYTLTAQQLSDEAGNLSVAQSVQLAYLVAETPIPGDAILSEIFCDPSPQIGLPEIEYIEIYNRSQKYFQLADWQISDADGQGTLDSAWLFPGTYKILCTTSGLDVFPMAVPVVSFPSLNNSGDALFLRDNTGTLLDKVQYTEDWYHDDAKAAGGYSLELINPKDPCSDISNWAASTDPDGGTPGFRNAVHDTTADVTPPQFFELLASAPNLLEVVFNEGMDSLSLVNAVTSFEPALIVQQATLSGNPVRILTLEFEGTLAGSQPYKISLSNVADCWQNTQPLQGQFSLAETALPGDIVINEILFNPITGGADFVELRNNSTRLIDLKDWNIAHFESDTISDFVTIPMHWFLAPGAHVVVTPDSATQLQQYPAAIPGHFIQLSLPSLNNDSSTVFLLQGDEVMDVVSYTADWHFALLDDLKAKSLERIDPAGPSNDRQNWHTAAETIGFATPGGENSQFNPALSTGDFALQSKIISPDNDGTEDVLQARYAFQKPGMLGSVHIYDERGSLVKALFKNELLSTQGTIQWDGTTDQAQKAGIGTYVLIFEAFHLDSGITYLRKEAFVVAGKM